jgi:hypothetical protein
VLIRKLAVLVTLTAGLARADSLTDITESCGWANLSTGKYWLIQCLQEAFTAYPAHLVLGTIAPGSGTVAVGPNYTKSFPFVNSEIALSSEALISTDTSWLLQTQALMSFPALGANLSSNHGLLWQGDVDAKGSVILRARVYDAKQQWFYGLGPSTSLAGNSEYSQKEVDLRAGINNPVTAWGVLGANVDFLRPRIGNPWQGVSTDTLYNDAEAPGLHSTDDFVRVEPYVALKIPPHRSLASTARISYSFYHSLGADRFSFGRLSGSDITQIPLLIPVRPPKTVSQRSAKANFLCPSVRSGAHCSAGEVSLIERVDASYTRAGNVAPFYFDPTLGGQDMQGNDTLRGFGDYRFRAPNRVLLQAEYRHPIWSVIGLVVFYDLGKVAFSPGDLTLARLRHDIGLGLEISVANRPVMRLSIAFGSGEPAQLQPRFGEVL